jgi:subtilase family serine protease
MRLLHALALCLPVLAFATVPQLPAQNPSARARITEPIDENQLVSLAGNTHPAANVRNDQGRVSPDLAMSDLILVLSRSDQQQAAFDAFVASQYDASSPNFHHWLEPAEVGQQFGPSSADIATLSNWLSSRGFSVTEVSKDRMTIRFNGTASGVENAFHTEIHNLSVNGERHIANMSDPKIPLALSPVVVGVKALHNFIPRPMHKLGMMATLNKDTGEWQHVTEANPGPALSSGGIARPLPQFGITGSSNGQTYTIEDVSPYDFASIYNVLPLWNAPTPINGTGQTIAVAGTSDINLKDVATFRGSFGLAPGLTPIIDAGVNGLDPGICTSTSPTATCGIGDLIENSLDVEWAGAVATGAQVVLVTSGILSSSDDPIYDSSSYVVGNIGNSASPVANAHILNVSYGACELAEGTAGNTAYSNLWQTAATEGVAVFVASGDAGSAACDQGLDVNVPYEAQFGLSVSGLASSPYDTAVGGTDLNWGTNPAPYWSATNNATTGASAAGYIPEVPWNDTCTNPLTLAYLQQTVVPALVKQGYTVTSPTDAETSCNFVLTWNSTIQTVFNVNLAGFVDVVGAGGGASACTSSDGTTVASCTGGYAKPSWQAGVTGIPSDGKRDVPDVSFFASNGFLGSAYLICVSALGSCTYSASSENTAQEVGGTSVASPAMAGVMAMINQKTGSAQGSPNAELYTLASKQTYASCSAETTKSSSSCYFNDIDTGTIAMPCMPNSPTDPATDCTVAHSGDTVAVLSGYGAAAGYDQATGLGSLNVANVVNAWTQTSGPGTATLTVTPAETSITVSQSLSVTVALSGSGPAPTGTVTLVGPGYVGGVQTVGTGPYTFTIPAYGINGGSDTLTATYSGDTNYAAASITATITVSKLGSSAALGAASSTIDTGQTLSVTATISGPGITPTGTVVFSSGSYTSAPQPLSAGAATFSIPSNSLAVGSDTITATYSGDGNYNASSATTGVTATQSLFSLSASTPAAVSPGTTAQSSITVNSSTNYSGTVTLTCSLNSGGPTNSAGDAPSCSIPATGVPGGGSAVASVTTTAATTSALTRPSRPGRRTGPAEAAGTLMAVLVLLGIPQRRRRWQAMIGIIVLLVSLGGLASCGGGGGGGGGSGGGGTSNPGTAAGTYTFTVTGTGNPAVSPAPTTTFSMTVN